MPGQCDLREVNVEASFGFS